VNPEEAQDAMLAGYREAMGTSDEPPIVCPACGHRFHAAVRVTEADATTEAISGRRSARDVRDLITKTLEDRIRNLTGKTWAYAWVLDHSDTEVVYEHDGKTWQCTYDIAGEGTVGVVTLGEPAEVIAQTWYVPAAGGEPVMPATEAQAPRPERIDGRVIEAKGTAADGGRVFGVRIIAAGDSKNGRRYPAEVLREAVSLYEGAKAYDHHRTVEELRSSTISGMVGYYRNVEASDEGLDGDLCLLPSATHTAEALDATLAAQADGLPPLVGISHDAMTVLKPITTGGRRLMEATSITKVNSADVVADPSAGGKATRVLAGGIDEPAGAVPDGESTKESDVTVTSADVLAALKTATPEQLAAVGLSKVTESTTEPEKKSGSEPVKTTEATNGAIDKTSFLGKLMVKDKIEAAGLPAAVVESLIEALPDRITEADIDGQVSALKSVLGVAERAGLAPTATTQVTKEAFDKKIAALDGMLDHTGRTPGYRSFKAAWADITGARVLAWDEDINRRIIRESLGGGYDSHGRVGNGAEQRTTESLTTASWPQVLGDSITRRAIALYATPALQTWQRIVSAMPPVNDFREQKRERVGGYGILPTVAQGAPYQPLTSPTDEEAVYSVMKRGGTEDLTWETVVNDDLGKVQQIPRNLGLAAAITLYRFVWDIFKDNTQCSYDSTALFHADHGNLNGALALSQSGLSTARVAMRSQAAYGQSVNILSTVPRLLVVPNELEELAYQLTTSAVAVPGTPAGPSDTPNLHRGLDYEVIDYWTDANDWFLVADPLMIPTIEVGFLFGNQEPELFTQADPNIGSVFNADTITYKIRHVYSGTPLDHRGVFKGQG